MAEETKLKIENMAKIMREDLKNCGPPSSECSIYQIPEWIKEQNVKAYEPQMVSIGPLHHGNKRLQTMEAYKRMYFEDFLGRTPVSLEDLIKFIMEREKRVRESYADKIECEEKDFIKMILIDAAFVIEILLRYTLTELRYEDDRIFSKEGMVRNIWADFWLLENQLPLFIIEDLFSIAKVYPIGESRFIIKLALDFLQFGMPIKASNLGKLYHSRIEHFLDLLRICHLPLDSTQQAGTYSQTLISSAMDLHQAGVKFKQASSKDLFKIQFRKGVIEIPRLTVSFKTEIIFRNLLVYEFHHCTDNYINDYLIIMDRLINTPEDVDLLAKADILDIWVGDSNEVTTLINNLGKTVTFYPASFFFAEVCNKVTAYRNSRVPNFIASIQQHYFYTHWAVVSTIGALILLALTTTQTIFGIIKD